jgi:type VI secretion system protein ImpG
LVHAFLDLEGLDAVWPAGFKDRAEIIFLISSFEPDYQQRMQLGISSRTFRLGCCPVINLVLLQLHRTVLVHQENGEVR